MENSEKSLKQSWFVTFPATRILQLKGHESLDLLQRISTNDLATLATGSWVQTLFTSEKGKIVDLVWVGKLDSDQVYVIGGAGSPQRSRRWIEKFVIMEDIQVTESDGSFGHIVVCNAHPPLPSVQIQFREDRPTEALLHLFDKGTQIGALAEALRAGGAKEKTLAEYEDHRIRTGIPALGHELTEEYNPLEAGIDRLISWTKGCYVGQEVIARLDTYKKVQKKLARLSFSERIMTIPGRIMSPTGEIGVVTSATMQEPFVGLGYLFTGQKVVTDQMYVETGEKRIRVMLKE